MHCNDASNSVVVSAEDPAQRPALGIVTRRRYALARGRLEARPRAGAFHAEDLRGFFKPFTDVVLEGQAHARGSATTLATGLRVGDVAKRVDVSGDRRLVVKADGSMAAGRPEPFSCMPLSWSRAYGGHDRYADAHFEEHGEGIERYGAFAYPRNREGVGYYLDLDRARLDGAPMPNLSDPDDPVEVSRLLSSGVGDWIDRPAAAGYGRVDRLSFPRCLHYRVGVHSAKRERAVHEVRLRALAASDLDPAPGRPDPRAYQCASPGLGSTRLAGNERLSLWHLHRDHELLELDLPGERPRLLIEPPGTRTFELEPRLATVLIEPDEDRITLTWTGSMAVAAVFPQPQCAEMWHAAIFG
jgi:hypothetical protein